MQKTDPKTENIPLFSIISVTRNNLAGLKETAGSVAAQTFRDFEWIVVDGASTDGTAEWLQEQGISMSDTPLPTSPLNRGEGFSTISPPPCKRGGSRRGVNVQKYRDILWTSEPDRGIYDAMNKGIERAQGSFLLFLNAGDTLAGPDVLERIKREIGALPVWPDFLYGDSLEGENRKPARPPEGLKLGLFTHHQAMLYRRERIGGLRYDLSYKIAADYDFTARFLRGTEKTLYMPFPVCVFEPGGVSQTNAKAGRREQFRSRAKLGLCSPAENFTIYAAQTALWTFRRAFPRLYWALKSSRSTARGRGQNHTPPAHPETPA